MSKGVQTAHGLKYTLPDHIYLAVENADGGTNNVWNRINAVIEAATLLPAFVGVLVFCILSFMKILPWYMIPVYALLSIIPSTIISNFYLTLKIPFILFILTLFQCISKFLLHFLLIILVAVLIVNNWLAALIYIVGSFILNSILTFSIGGYQQREMFNARVAKSVLSKL